jgi:hypothetical protein
MSDNTYEAVLARHQTELKYIGQSQLREAHLALMIMTDCRGEFYTNMTEYGKANPLRRDVVLT